MHKAMLTPWQQAGIWLVLYGLWSVVSRSSHPTLQVDLAVTAVLLAAFAAAVYLNQLVLLPRLLNQRGRTAYGLALLAAMGLLTFLAITTLRWTYVMLGSGQVLGPFWPNYLIDFGGMAVHVTGAAAVVQLSARKLRAN